MERTSARSIIAYYFCSRERFSTAIRMLRETPSIFIYIATEDALLIAPREKGFEGACVAVDAIGGEVRVPHTDNHCIQIRLLEHGNVHLYIHVPRHGLKLGLIALQSLFGKSFGFSGNDEVFESFLDGCAHY